MFLQQERGQVPLLHNPLQKGWKEGSASRLPQLQGSGGVGAWHGADQSRPASPVAMTTVRSGQVGLPQRPWQHCPEGRGPRGKERRANCSCPPPSGVFSPSSLPYTCTHDANGARSPGLADRPLVSVP